MIKPIEANVSVGMLKELNRLALFVIKGGM